MSNKTPTTKPTARATARRFFSSVAGLFTHPTVTRTFQVLKKALSMAVDTVLDTLASVVNPIINAVQTFNLSDAFRKSRIGRFFARLSSPRMEQPEVGHIVDWGDPSDVFETPEVGDVRDGFNWVDPSEVSEVTIASSSNIHHDDSEEIEREIPEIGHVDDAFHAETPESECTRAPDKAFRFLGGTTHLPAMSNSTRHDASCAIEASLVDESHSPAGPKGIC